MKCNVEREQILEAVLQTEKVTVKNHTLPVLSCVLLEVSNKTLFLTATNLEVGIRFSVDVQGEEDGVVAVSGSVLSHVISSLSKGVSVTFEKKKGFLHIISSEGTSKIAVQNTEDFPTLPEVIDGEKITIPAQIIKNAVQSVVYCASNSTIKPELSSVFIHAENGVLITTATDSFRLAEKRIVLKEPISTEPFLIPSKSTQNLLRVLEYADKKVDILTNKHQLSITIDNIYFTLRLTVGSFPDYTQIIPKEFVTEATLLTYDFERTLKKAIVFSDQFNQTKLSLSPKKKLFTIHTKNETIGETTDNISAALKGEQIEISFNQRYLTDSLHSITSDSVVLQFAGQSQPLVVRPIGDDSFLYLVMPMNR
jgi:DNA polymerase-3 subunit beta